MTNPDALAALADENFRAMLHLCAEVVAGGEVTERGGMVLCATGLPEPMFNVGFVMRPLASPAEDIAAAVAYFDTHEVPFIIRLREGVDLAAEHACEALGLPYSDTVPGMVRQDLANIPERAGELRVKPVRDMHEMKPYIDVLAEGFGMPRELAVALGSENMLHRDELRLFLGYAGAQPVATAMSLRSGNTVGVYNVATVPSDRRRGIGEEMTWHCLRAGASQGCTSAALQASDMGKPIYERMGFVTVAPYRTFHRPGV